MSRQRKRPLFVVSPWILLLVTVPLVGGLVAEPDVPREALWAVAGGLTVLWLPWLLVNLIHWKYSGRPPQAGASHDAPRR